MCFNSKTSSSLMDFIKDAIPKVAKRNITVYKVVRVHTSNKGVVSYRGLYRKSFKYTGLVQSSPLIIDDTRNPSPSCYYFGVNRGFHSCRTYRSAYNDHLGGHLQKVKKFIIPKGALYFFNGREYTSNKLKLIK